MVERRRYGSGCDDVTGVVGGEGSGWEGRKRGDEGYNDSGEGVRVC